MPPPPPPPSLSSICFVVDFIIQRKSSEIKSLDKVNDLIVTILNKKHEKEEEEIKNETKNQLYNRKLELSWARGVF